MSWYSLVLGLRPGIYDNWDECDLAIGDRNPPPPLPKPHWRRKDTKEEAEKYFTEMTAAFSSAFEASHRFQRQMNEMQTEVHELKRKIALQDDNQQQSDAKIARLETVVQQTKPLHFQLESILEPVRAIIGQVKSSQAENPFKLQIEASGHCSVRTQVEIGPEDATFGVYFGDGSPLNGTFAWFKEVDRTESAGEILAAIVALQTARDAGIERLRIYSKSAFVKISTGDSRRANKDLLTMLDTDTDLRFDWVAFNEGIATQLTKDEIIA